MDYRGIAMNDLKDYFENENFKSIINNPCSTIS